MKLLLTRRAFIFLVILVLFSIAGGVYWLSLSRASIGNLQVYKGEAKVFRDKNVLAATTGMNIHISDEIETGSGSRVALVLKDGTIIRLEKSSQLQVAELNYQGEKLQKAQFRLVSGQAWSRVKPLSADSQFQVETPNVTASVRGTIFNTTLEDNETGIYVDHHAVLVTLKTNNKSQSVNSAKILWMHNDNLDKDFGKGQAELPARFLQEDWIVFNKSEDEKLCKTQRDIPECSEATYVAKSTPTAIPTATLAPKKIIIKATPTKILTPTPQPTSQPTPTNKPESTPTPTLTIAPTATPTPTKVQTQYYPVIFMSTPTPTPYIIR